MGPMRLGQSKNFTDFILVLRLISSLVPSFSFHKMKFSDSYNMCQKTNKIMMSEQFGRPYKTSGGYIFKDADKDVDKGVDKWVDKGVDKELDNEVDKV